MHSSSIHFIIFSFERLEQSISRGQALVKRSFEFSQLCQEASETCLSLSLSLAPAGYFLHVPTFSLFFFLSSSLLLLRAYFLVFFFFSFLFIILPFFLFYSFLPPSSAEEYKDPRVEVDPSRVSRGLSCFQSSRVRLYGIGRACRGTYICVYIVV